MGGKNDTSRTDCDDIEVSQDTIHIVIIAHPDDESMFFLPTIHYLMQECREDKVWIMCLTNGNYDGIGKKRQRELANVASILDVSKVIMIDDEDIMPDHPNQSWKVETVSEYIHHVIVTQVLQLQQLKQSLINQRRTGYIQGKEDATTNRGVATKIHVNVVTFDEFGVSGHVNHRDTYYGVRHWLGKFCREYQDNSCTYRLEPSMFHEIKTKAEYEKHIIVVDNSCKASDQNSRPTIRNNNNIGLDNADTTKTMPIISVSAWELHSNRNPLTKYLPVRSWISLLVIYLFSLLTVTHRCWAIHHDVLSSHTSSLFSSTTTSPDPMTLQHLWKKHHVNDGALQPRRMVSIFLRAPKLNWIAMKTHASQFVWYRRLFVIFSCYTYENQLRSITLPKTNIS
jgi:LmbE family N-acetylglucosaminyl deacetylase